MKLFSKKKQEGTNKESVEDFANLIRIYFQAALADRLGISNLAMLPDMRIFKQSLKIPTENNRLGRAEKRKCKQMLQTMFALPNHFFSEIDNSIKKHARNMQQMQEYLFRFQSFSQDLLTVVTSDMGWKVRIPLLFKNTLRHAISQSIEKVFTKSNFKDVSLAVAAQKLQKQSKQLGFSPDWALEYIYHIVVLAKKQKKTTQDDNQ